MKMLATAGPLAGWFGRRGALPGMIDRDLRGCRLQRLERIGLQALHLVREATEQAP
jgi:hypothetical protein